jgi:predicted transcriptional regulator
MADDSSPVMTADFVRTLILRRRKRDRLFPPGLFGEPAWDMLLDLAAARLEGHSVSATSLALAAAVPVSTAQRYIAVLLEFELIQQRDDPADGRRTQIELTAKGWEKMTAYLLLPRP